MAPWVSLRFAPDGRVHACGVNDTHPVGHIGDQGIGEIWQGPELQALRSALAGGDFSLGCDECGDAIVAAKRGQVHAASYDLLAPSRAVVPERPLRLELALSNRCNLQCVQCTGELSSAIRARREGRPPLPNAYGDRFFDELRSYLPHLRVVTFIGGEPFLARENRRVWDDMIELGTDAYVHVTTNGTVWNDVVERYVRALRMSIALSIDGVEAETVAALRVGSDLDVLHEHRDRFLALTRELGTDFTLNYCVMPQNWHEFAPFLLEAEMLGVLVYVARVVKPPAYSPFSLPLDELDEVVAGMEAQSVHLEGRLPINRAVWENTLADLRDHRRHLREEPEGRRVAVQPSRGAVALDAIERELHAWSGSAPIRLEIRGGVVAEVVGGGPWSEAAQSWRDWPESEVLAGLERVLGSTIGPPTIDHQHGALRHRYRLVDERTGTHRELRAVVLGDDPLDHDVCLAVSRVPEA